jgi:DNA-binding LacI/PurR family transcriptional regulator
LAHINLTTVRQDSAGLARAAMERLASRLDGSIGEGRAVDIVCTPALVVRGSTAAPSS